MTTNLLATVIVAVVTNWTDQYQTENMPTPWSVPFTNFYLSVTNVAVPCPGDPADPNTLWYSEPMVRRLIGREGRVVETTTISFEWQGPRELRIEKTLATITQKCRERPPKPVELEWDEPIRTPYYDGPVTNINATTITLPWTCVDGLTVQAITNDVIENLRRDIEALREQVEKGGGR